MLICKFSILINSLRHLKFRVGEARISPKNLFLLLYMLLEKLKYQISKIYFLSEYLVTSNGCSKNTITLKNNTNTMK